MKRSWILAIIAANLAVLIALVFLYPEAMIGPGRLAPGHANPPIACAGWRAGIGSHAGKGQAKSCFPELLDMHKSLD